RANVRAHRADGAHLLQPRGAETRHAPHPARAASRAGRNRRGDCLPLQPRGALYHRRHAAGRLRIPRPMRKIGTWLAVLAIALHALWPLLANARPTSVNLVPICTVEGITHYLDVPRGKSALDDSAAKTQ